MLHFSTMRKLEIAPSILSANFARLGEDVMLTHQAGADRIHIDVMDGHFVPNITMGPVIIQSIRPITILPFDVHLMISNPDQYLEPFAKAGATVLIPHIEVAPDVHKTVTAIHDLGCQAGVAISPDTPVESIRDIAPHVEQILVMSVYPGFSGGSFIEGSFERIRQIRKILDACGSKATIGVDGGVDTGNIGALAKAGATNLVAATAIYKAGIPISEAIHRLRKAAEAGL
jgi:ribulose-phosphate 3-epimerase